MKKILILGAGGMSGHMITRYLTSLNKYNIISVSRNNDTDYKIDIQKNLCDLSNIISIEDPDVIINCIGLLVKPSYENPEQAIYINSFFPHWLRSITKKNKIKIIHLSTDCIFDGTKGNYKEKDFPSETSWYGRTKAMGEINDDKNLTLRMSIIGTELKLNGTGLFHWFMQQKGDVRGFSKCIWTGVTTLQLAKSIDDIITNTINLCGIYHLVPNKTISKYELLRTIARIWNKTDVTIIQDNTVKQNKSLINTRLKEYDPQIPDYETQLNELFKFTLDK